MRKTLFSILILALIFSSFGFDFYGLEINLGMEGKDLPKVKDVDLKKFIGHWYEIAKLSKDEIQSVCNQVNFEVQGGKILANATCFLKDDLTNLEQYKSFLVPTDNSNTEFEILDKKEMLVVIDIADDYSWVLLGNPEKTSLWIKSREPELDFKIIQKLILEARKTGFPVNELNFIPQICGNNYDLE